MENLLKSAFDRIKANDTLKNKTLENVLNQEKSLSHIRTSTTAKRPRAVKKLVTAACAALLLCALPLGAYAVYQTPTSYLSVDINPSVELCVNTFGKVISVLAYNDDGQTVIDGLSLKNCTVTKAVKLIISAATKNGFIDDDGSTYIAITAESNSTAAAEKLNLQAKNGASEAMAEKGGTAAVETNQIGLDRRDEAVELGITPGRLNLVEKLLALAPDMDEADYMFYLYEASVTQIQNRFIELKKQQQQQQEQNEELNQGSALNQELNQEQNNEYIQHDNGNGKDSSNKDKDVPSYNNGNHETSPIPASTISPNSEEQGHTNNSKPENNTSEEDDNDLNSNQYNGQSGNAMNSGNGAVNSNNAGKSGG